MPLLLPIRLPIPLRLCALRRPFAAALLLCLSPLAWAARPLVTDDARIVDPQSCQLESWLRFNRDGTERWALPGCNFTGNFEWTFGGAVQRYGDGPGNAITDLQFQGKTVLKPVETNGYGVALTLGMTEYPKAERRRTPGGLYLNLPLTVSMRDDRLLLHANFGATHDRAERQTRMTWGVAGEAAVSERWAMIAESFGESGDKPWIQLGARVWIVPQRVQVDMTWGTQLNQPRETRFVSIGLRLLSPSWGN
ncbi:hypothetical protein [Cupriavidus cauae]|uniref:Transporter n=1 Tax=Cupriavidus cauae TaxID=2608999 RepID=A0A5M8AS83_9BURK|nr:hypothetical protein [Cupriavidus cauae]KAA6123724.1 hypothetical protein F1599_12315 [Cupriavidus cauae]